MAFLPAIAAVAGIVGAGVSAVGAVEQGQATSNAANYSAQVARNNALIAQQNASYATAAGVEQADIASRKGAAIGGKIKAAQAANNIDVNTGSALGVQAGQRETSKLDTETVLNNAELQAYGYRTQATGYTAQAGLYSAEAAQAPIGAAIGATGSLLSNASSLGMKWTQANPTGGGAGGGGSGQPLSLNPADYTS